MLKLFTILSSILLYNAFLFGQVFNISPSSLNFGNVVLGSSSTLQTTISNPDTIDLVINGITSSNGEFIFTPNTFPDTITAGGSQVFDVTFTPTVTGLLSGTLTITHNASGSPTVYSVQGTGVAAGFSISPASLSFGNVVLGSSSTLQATISNPGTSDLVINGITSSSGEFIFTPNTFPDTITAGGSQVFDVTFTPTVTGLLAGTLTITHNASGSPTVYSVQGTGVAAGFSISPVSLSFGNVVLGSSSTLQTTISNPGTSDLVISGISSSATQFTFSPNVFPVTITAGGSQVFDVTFTPTVTGLLAGTLTITHNAAGSPTVYSVQGTGVAAGFSISPVSLSFGNVVLGSSSTLQTTISNPGTSDLVINGITSSNGEFIFTPNTFPDTITAGGSQIFDVTFTPSVTGLLAGTLTITHNASGSPTVYSVQGTGVAAGFSISPASLSFGNVVLGSSSTLQTTISNPGTSDLVISGISSSATQFTFSPNVFPVTITAGGSQVFDVIFTPTVTGLLSGTLTITHNAAGSPTVYSVQGTGVAAGFSISPVSLSFGNVVLGSSSTLQTTISNPGTSDLVINGITSSNGEFIFTPNTFPDTITAGGSQIFDVTFTPTMTGLLSGTLTITHNASGSPTVYSVQGTGVAAGFSISPASLSFGNVVLGSSSTLQATISNPGTSDLVISGISSSATQFTFSPNVFPVTITAGGSQVFDVIFTPTVTGLLSGTLTITHNASGSPTIYSVQGIGIEAFSSSLNLLNLVNVITSSIVDTQFTVTNNGTVPLLMNTNITDAPNWNISPDTVLIPAGSNFIFTLTFSAPAMPTTFADTLTLSTVGFPSLKIPLSANVVSDAGIIFELDSVYKLEDNSYMEIMQLKNLTDSLHAFQFRIQVNKEISDNVILIFQNIQKGTDVADASWILRSTITRGPITPNGASMDEVFVLLYNINQGAGLAPGNYNNLFRVNYTVADLEPLQDSLKSTFRITHVEGSDYQGLPIDITPSRDLLNVIARNRVSWRGDVNSDGYLDVLDLIMVVDHIVNVDSLNATEFF
ncbi:MAG: choice-of-anchor D domain-containing protein [Ignavibacteriaceae bacterium]|nr:choice-of-anchor D domain-containing protein [Ignavibacteriaceae bacterium]